MIRFQCPHCRGIVASEKWEAGAAAVCAYCSKEAFMPEDRLGPGMVIGDFLLINKLGEGGMGIVFKAYQLSLDRPAAIKILNAEFSQQADSVQAFIKEARSAAKLNHPNIVQAYAVGEDDGIFYFAMEFIDGQTMKSVLQDCKKIEPRKAAEIIMQVAEGLDCAWREQKLIHHDIKPDNIMQCANERVKLADLGLAGKQGEDGNDDSDEVVGTPQYISPEQLTGVATDTRSDIYSLGATFYHFVTGQFPYNGANTDEIARQHVYGTLVPPKNVNPDLPQALSDIIVKMMGKTPAERYQNCGELVKALKDFLANDGKAVSSGGLTGSTKLGSAKETKLGGGLSGNVIQPKVLTPPGAGKLSLKIAGKKEEKAPEVAVQEPAAAAAGAEADKTAAPKSGIKLAIKKPADAASESTLNLAMNKPKVEMSAPQKISIAEDKSVPQAAAEAAAEVVPPAEVTEAADNAAPAEAPAAKPVIKLNVKKAAPAPEPAPAAPSEVEKTEENSEKSEVKAEETVVEKSAEAAENAEPVKTENSDGEETVVPENEKKSGKAGLIITIVVILLLALGGAGGWWYMNSNGKKADLTAENENTAPVVKFELPQAVETAPQAAAPEPEVAVYKPTAAPKAPVLSAFMKEVRNLENLYLSSEAGFVQAWKQRSGKLKPKTAEEKKFFDSLDENFVMADERVTVEPSRKPLLAAYNKKVADIARAAEMREKRQRMVDAEKELLAFSEASAENYAADLPRKMGMLDYAMITAAKTRRPADWQNFQKALTLAKNEPQRVADREGFAPTAKLLAEYAERLEFVAEQGKEFTELLEKNKFKNKKIKGENAEAIILSSNRNMVVFSVTTFPKVEAPKVAPKPKAPAKGKGGKGKKAAPKPKPKPKAKTAKPTKKVHKIALMIKKPEEAVDVKAWMDVLERDMGRRDQYFYYMLYNGYLQHSIAAIAPDKFWKKRVDKVMRGFFDRSIFIANAAQLASLEKVYGSWDSFREALKDFKEKQ